MTPEEMEARELAQDIADMEGPNEGDGYDTRETPEEAESED